MGATAQAGLGFRTKFGPVGRFEFSAAHDRLIIDGREMGVSWEAIAQSIGCSAPAAEARARLIKARGLWDSRLPAAREPVAISAVRPARANNPLGARADRKKFADGIAELRRPENEPVPLADASGARLTILTARANQCRWIAGDAAAGEICGHPGTPYCPHHAARARVAGRAKLAPGERPTVWQLPGAFGRTHAL